MRQRRSDRDERIVRAAFARFDVIALAVAMGSVGALFLWSATVILLAKGAPPGVAIGPHLGLLANFLPGYSVSWPGSVIALMYGFLIGLAVGAVIAIIANIVHHIYLVLVSRSQFAGDL